MDERTESHGEVDQSAPAPDHSAFKADFEKWEASRSTRRLIARTKTFLEATFADPIRLTDIAQAVGASPAYLTDVFSRVEGVPLHRYLMQVRLARALVELPDARDITALALSLGFSSHSHFTASFRRAFGCTPSQFRNSTRNPARSASDEPTRSSERGTAAIASRRLTEFARERPGERRRGLVPDSFRNVRKGDGSITK